MHAKESFRKLGIQLYENFLCLGGIGRHIADAATEHNLAGIGNIGGFDDCEVDVAVCSVAHFLGHLRKMTVIVVAVVGVDALAEIGHILIGRTHVVCVGT